MRTAIARYSARLAVAGAVACSTLLAGYSLLDAAAVYSHSTPGPSASLASSPGRIDIWTHRPTMDDDTLTQIAVTDVSGNHYETGATVIDASDHTHFFVNLQQQMPVGRFLVWFKTEGQEDYDRDGGMFAIYIGETPSKADLSADSRLVTTTVDGGDDGPISGVERGVVEGGIPLFIAGGAFLWYRKQHIEERDDFIPLDDRGTPIK